MGAKGGKWMTPSVIKESVSELFLSACKTKDVGRKYNGGTQIATFSLKSRDQELSNGIQHSYLGMSYTVGKLLNPT